VGVRAGACLSGRGHDARACVMCAGDACACVTRWRDARVGVCYPRGADAGAMPNDFKGLSHPHKIKLLFIKGLYDF